jgi:hypothetical protein
LIEPLYGELTRARLLIAERMVQLYFVPECHILFRLLHSVTESMFGKMSRRLGERSQLMRACTIADAALIAATSSVKNQHHAHPNMHQAKKRRRVALPHECAHWR